MVDGYDETLREQFHSDPFSPSLPLTHDYSHTLSLTLSLSFTTHFRITPVRDGDKHCGLWVWLHRPRLLWLTVL